MRTCSFESVYGADLTRGRAYEILEIDEAKRQIRVKGNRGRVRWYPAWCFDPGGNVVTLERVQLDDKITDPEDDSVEVTVELSSGERRWCLFVTPHKFCGWGDYLAGTTVRFHFGGRHVIIAERLSRELIEGMLRFIDGQGMLSEVTLPLGSDGV